MNKSVSLYYKNGGSDKVYAVQIEHFNKGQWNQDPGHEGFAVLFQYGRRSSALTSGTKTNKGLVSEVEAEKIYAKAVKSKLAEGYTEGEAGTPFQGQATKEVSGLVPQLLNTIDDSEVEGYMAAGNWCVQEKYDGVNRMLVIMARHEGSYSVAGVNKKGLFVPVPDTIHRTAILFGAGVLCGEQIGDILYVHDLLEKDGRNLRQAAYEYRYSMLLNALAAMPSHVGCAFQIVATAWKVADKRRMVKDLLKSNVEGFVLKDVDAGFTPGRPNSGGAMLKVKFYATASVIVDSLNAKRSVNVFAMEDRDTTVQLGSVTIPPNKELPKMGDVIEVRYLYAYKGGCLYQPVYIGVRDDVDTEECTTAQLKYKREEE